MTLFQFCDLIDSQLVIYRRPGKLSSRPGNNRYYCKIEDAEIKKGIMLGGIYGDGATVRMAAVDYISQIRGKKIILNAMSKTFRREYDVPADLII